MNRQVKRILVLIVGWLFILVGIAGLFLPILQGALFIVIGLVILSSEYVWAHHLLQRAKQKFPRMASHVDSAEARIQRWISRCSRTPE